MNFIGQNTIVQNPTHNTFSYLSVSAYQNPEQFYKQQKGPLPCARRHSPTRLRVKLRKETNISLDKRKVTLSGKIEVKNL